MLTYYYSLVSSDYPLQRQDLHLLCGIVLTRGGGGGRGGTYLPLPQKIDNGFVCYYFFRHISFAQ